MRVSLKSGSSDAKDLEIEDSTNVKTLRAKVAESYDTTPDLVVLIFAGKIIKDEQTLAECKITDGLSLHVVLKKAKTPAANTSSSKPAAATSTQPTASATPAATTTTATPASSTQPSNPMESFFGTGMSGQNFEQMQQQMMNNPEMMSRVLDNPLISSVMSDPGVMQELINSNPQLRGLMDSHPEIRGMLNNPEMMRQAMQMARNPQAMQEMMRNQDRAMQNIESYPGGFNALRRMHEDIVEPMQDAMGGGNPFEQLANSNNSNSNENNSNTETTSSLPNPWGANNNSNSQNNSNTGSGGAPRPQMTAGLQEAMMNAMMNNIPGAENLPEGARAQMGRLFSNPGAMQAMNRPVVREAMMQIQQGIATINREAPEVARLMGIPDTMGQMPPGMEQMMGGMGRPAAAAASAAAPADNRPPEERYATQLTQLEQMGFMNRQNNIAALQATGGNVEAAIDRLVGQM